MRTSISTSFRKITYIVKYMVFDFNSITDNHSDLGMAIHFAPKVFGSSMGMRVRIVLSAFENVLAVTYTSTRGMLSIDITLI